MKTIEEKIAVMQAYAEGKKIERQSVARKDGWEDCPNPTWNWYICDYRIKTEPKYRPYKDADECFADWLKHKGMILFNTNDGLGNKYALISNISGNTVYCPSVNITFGALLADGYVWADDRSPCGVWEEE